MVEKWDAPYFYGVAQNFMHYYYEDVGEVKEGFSNVIFVLSGEYQWLNVNKLNTKQLTVNDELPTFWYGSQERATESDES